MGPPVPVVERSDRVVILGCGPSVAGLDVGALVEAGARGVTIIGVNRSACWALDALTHWMTLDPDHRVRPLLDRPMPGVRRYAAVPDDYGQPDARVPYHRGARLPPDVHRLRRVEGTGVLRSRERLAEDPAAIHTGNSAWGALGLAYHMRPSRVALLGVDARGEDGYAGFPGRPRTDLRHLPQLFASASEQLCARGIEVCNGSPESRVACFQLCRPLQAIDWILSGV